MIRFIGRVVAFNDMSVSIRQFDTLGVWEDEPSVIAYGEITKVQFDTPYINTFIKYLKQTHSTNGRFGS